MIIDANKTTINQLKNCAVINHPVFYNEQDFKKWDRFFWFVENCEFDIAVNSLYFDVRKMCSSRIPHSGGSSKNPFNFWFRSLYDREAFVAYVSEILK